LDQEQRAFAVGAPLIFVASRNAAGDLDVSPRGGQPTVLRPGPHGTLLLPDYRGNRRLDTIGNVLAHADVALLALHRRTNRYLRIKAQATVSMAPRHLRAFPADDAPALSVMVFTPQEAEFVDSDAFAESGFWIEPSERNAPLNLLPTILDDIAHFEALGVCPVPKDAAEEDGLGQHGIRDSYGFPSDLVQKKVTAGAGPGSLAFLRQAGFRVIARNATAGTIDIDVMAGGPPEATQGAKDLRLSRPGALSLAPEGAMGMVAMIPGSNEVLRINGTYRATNRNLLLAPREVYFHCSAALGRARIWQDDPRAPWTGQRRFTCLRVIDEAPGVRSFVMTPDDDAPIGDIAPGQFVSVALPGDLRRRSYSVSGRTDHSLRITVRRIGQGGLSDALHDTVAEESPMLLGIPAGRFVLDSAPGRAVVLASAGVGITPLLPMLETLVKADEARDIWFVHGARNADHHLFADEVRRIASRARQAAVHIVSAYSRPFDHDTPDHKGRIDATLLASCVAPDRADFYLCGPQAFMDALRTDLIAQGAAPRAIRTETFDAGDHAAAQLAARSGRAACAVTFAKSGKTATWTPDKGTLLDLAVSEGIEIAHSCRIGECQSCLLVLKSGRVDHPARPDVPLTGSQVLMCQALPDGDIEIDG
jgi:ferredoxin-NADP reductase